VTRLLWRQNLRWLLYSPWQTLVPLLGVALGVAAAVAIDLAKHSADQSFRLSTASVVGRASHALVGGSSGIDESIYRRLRVERGLRASAPVVEGSLRLRDRSLGLLGIDPYADAPMRPHLAPLLQSTGNITAALLTRPGAVLVSTETATALGLAAGETLEAIAGGRRQRIEVIGLLAPVDRLSRVALRDLVVCDISTAQELLGMRGRLSRVDLILPPDEVGEARLREAIRELLPPGAEITRSALRGEHVEQMTRAFRTNLTALSMLGLLVGMFLIYNALTFSVVRRRTLFGRLKSLGVTRGEILLLVLGEGAVIGAIGTLLGLALGVALADVLLGPVTRTLNDLYVNVSLGQVTLSPRSFGLGLGLGIGATLAAAALPALEATASPAVQVLARSNLEGRARARAPWLAAAGVATLLVCAGLLVASGRSLVAGIGALFLVVIGYALLVPGASIVAMRLARPPLRRAFGPLGAMACRGVETSLSRTGVAVAALAVAVSVTVGVDIMVGSFRDSVDRWLKASLSADIYVSPANPVAAGGPATAIHPELRARYSAAPGVRTTGTNRTVEVASASGPIQLAALDIGRDRYDTLLFVEGSTETTWTGFREGDQVVIPEPLAYRLQIDVGDRIELRTDAGPHAFRVAARVRSYASDQGVMLMHRATYDRYWDDGAINAIGIDVEKTAEVDAVMQELRARTPADVAVRIQSNRSLREASLEVFDRTFAVTRVLRAIALLVAFAGVIGALMALALERQREIGILRATGVLPHQVGFLVLLQTGLLGLLAGVLALPLGLGIAWLLVHVINRRSFGWSLDFVVTPEPLLQAVWIALVAALIAGLYPAVSMAHMRTADALREE
jgi:putative ABC transport system permease protein